VRLGGNVVAGPLYTPVGKTWQMDGAERAATIDRLVEGLKPLADYAGERGVLLAIEPLNRFETSFLNTAEQTMEAVERVAEHNVDATRPQQVAELGHAGAVEDVLAGVDVRERRHNLVAMIGRIGATFRLLRLQGRAVLLLGG
jgi:hypothetical protein